MVWLGAVPGLRWGEVAGLRVEARLMNPAGEGVTNAGWKWNLAKALSPEL